MTKKPLLGGEWEKKFDRRYLKYKGWILDGKNGAEIKKFISNLLQEQKQKYLQIGDKIFEERIIDGYSERLAHTKAIRDYQEKIRDEK